MPRKVEFSSRAIPHQEVRIPKQGYPTPKSYTTKEVTEGKGAVAEEGEGSKHL